jgi:hypothetical protein
LVNAGEYTGSIKNCVSLSTSIVAESSISSSYSIVGRVTGERSGGTGNVLATNYGNNAMAWSPAGPDTINGEPVAVSTTTAQSWWTGTTLWTVAGSKAQASESAPWVWGTSSNGATVANRPALWFEVN